MPRLPSLQPLQSRKGVNWCLRSYREDFLVIEPDETLSVNKRPHERHEHKSSFTFEKFRITGRIMLPHEKLKFFDDELQIKPAVFQIRIEQSY